MKTKKDVIEMIQSMSFIKDVEIQRKFNSNECKIVINAVEKRGVTQSDLVQVINQIRRLEERNQIFNEKILRLFSQMNTLLNAIISLYHGGSEGLVANEDYEDDELLVESGILFDDFDFRK